MLDVIPPSVFEALQGHLHRESAAAQSGWESGSDEEDTLTGDFCGSLRTGWNQSGIEDGVWYWRIQYKKFRGRGPGALEKGIGADGIFQIEVHGPNGLVVTKGLLFQAKKEGAAKWRVLVDQLRKMESVAPNGSAVFEFGPDAFRAASAAILLREIDREPARTLHSIEPIGDYLSSRFLPCETGLRGMYYDAVRKNLIVPVAGGVRVIPTYVRHRVRIEAVHASQRERVVGENDEE